MAKKKRGQEDVEKNENASGGNDASEKNVQALASKAAASWAFLLEPGMPDAAAPAEETAAALESAPAEEALAAAEGEASAGIGEALSASTVEADEGAATLETDASSESSEEVSREAQAAAGDFDDGAAEEAPKASKKGKKKGGKKSKKHSAAAAAEAEASAGTAEPEADDAAQSAAARFMAQISKMSEAPADEAEADASANVDEEISDIAVAAEEDAETVMAEGTEESTETTESELSASEEAPADLTEGEESEMIQDLAAEREEDQDQESFLSALGGPELAAAAMDEEEGGVSGEALAGTELEGFESADIEELEFVEDARLASIVESILFASDRPVSLNQIKMVFKGTQVKTDQIRRTLDLLATELASANRGVTLEEVPGGYQLRTKVDNMQFLTRTLKAKPFKLSGPALETLAIVAYKQPLIKSEVDEIRGVESGHLLRALMEKGLINFEGKSDLPGKPMQYGTTRKFLEIFGLRNLKELPTLSQIDELLPEGMDEVEAEKPTLSQITDTMPETIGGSYSEGEDELMKISEQLQVIDTTTDFFEQEKQRERERKDADRAQSIREAILVGETVSTRDRNWLTRYDEALSAGQTAQFAKDEAAASTPAPTAPSDDQVRAFDQDADLDAASTDDTPSLFEEEVPADDEELAVPYHDEEDDEAEV